MYVSSLLLHILPSLLPFETPSSYFTLATLSFTLLYNLRETCSDTEPGKPKATAIINIHKTYTAKLNPMFTTHDVTSPHHGTHWLRWCCTSKQSHQLKVICVKQLRNLRGIEVACCTEIQAAYCLGKHYLFGSLSTNSLMSLVPDFNK